MPSPTSPANSRSISDRFRTWYEYERDCNAKTLKMIESVPHQSRSSAEFARAVGRMAHLVAARQSWLHRLGGPVEMPSDRFPATPLEQLPAAVANVEQAWTAYLAKVDDESIYRDFEFTMRDGKRVRWPLIDLLTQVFGHAWYHRGQIALLVKDLGGEAVDTDYIFWNRPTPVTG